MNSLHYLTKIQVVNKYRLIPIHLCLFALKNRFYNQFRSYLVLNFNGNGYFKRKAAIRLLITELGISRNSAKNHLKALKQRNWVGFNEGTIYVRSIDYIRRKEKATQRQSVWLNYKFLRNFKAFCFASIVTQTTKELRRLRKDELRGTSYQISKSAFFPIASDYLKQRYGISQPQITKLTALAESNGFIDVKRSMIPFKPNGVIYKAKDIGFVRSSVDEKIAKKLRIKSNIVVEQLPNEMRSILDTKKRRRA